MWCHYDKYIYAVPYFCSLACLKTHIDEYYTMSHQFSTKELVEYA